MKYSAFFLYECISRIALIVISWALQASANLEIEVTNLASKAGKGNFIIKIV
jgi:hypothetical protein